MAFDPYLHFQGNCAAAMTAYATLFGATDLAMMRYADAPDGTPEMAGSPLVMHASFTVQGRVLMASDYPPGMAGTPQASVTLSHTVPDWAGGKHLFDALAEDGVILMPYGKTFWAAGFGMVTDRFGTTWMVTTPGPDA